MEEVGFCKDCKAHSGFLESWTEAQDVVMKAVETAQAQFPDFRIVATGHSLGGAIATIATAAMRNKGQTVDLYTYGAPKSGNKRLASFVSGTDKGESFRVVHKNDVVPTLPLTVPFLLPYTHVQPEYLITTGNHVDVTANDIKVIQNGHDGGLDIGAHLWYFNKISACDGLFDRKARAMVKA